LSLLWRKKYVPLIDRITKELLLVLDIIRWLLILADGVSSNFVKWNVMLSRKW
jgi:hypothetical protein